MHCFHLRSYDREKVLSHLLILSSRRINKYEPIRDKILTTGSLKNKIQKNNKILGGIIMQRKRWRSVLSLLLAFMMVFGICIGEMPDSVKADEKVNFIVKSDKTELMRGETFEVTVEMKGNTSAEGLTWNLIYDDSMVELVRSEKGSVLNGQFDRLIEHPQNGQYNSIRATVLRVGEPIQDGTIMTAVFKVKDSAKGPVKFDSESEMLTGDYVDVPRSISYDDVDVLVPVTGISLNQTEMTLVKGASYELTAEVTPADAGVEAVWTSSAPSVAIVSDSGTVTAVGNGTATITAKAGNMEASCIVTVNSPLNAISIESTASTIKKGQTAQLTVIYDPMDTTDDRTVIWSSSGEFATVDENGLVTAIKDGTETITAKVGDKTAEFVITVKEVRLESVSIEQDQSVLRGKSLQLELIYNPEDTTDDKSAIWESSDSEIAVVDETTGMVTGIKEGTVTITATTKATNPKTDEPFKVTTEVTVKENHWTEDLSSQVVFDTLNTLYKNQSIILPQWWNLEEVLEKNEITDDVLVIWESQNEDILEVDSNGTARGLKEGTASVTATVVMTSGNGDTFEFEVPVTIEVREIPIQSIAFDKVIREMNVGETITLKIIYNPENTTDEKGVVWESSDESVISVNNGVIKGIKPGKSVITAKVGEKTVSCEITVIETETQNGSSDNNTVHNMAAVQTGDTADIMGCTLLLMFALAGGFIVLKRKKMCK